MVKFSSKNLRLVTNINQNSLTKKELTLLLYYIINTFLLLIMKVNNKTKISKHKKLGDKICKLIKYNVKLNVR